MKPVLSITFAYHFGQLLKLLAFALIVHLFDYTVLGEAALYLAYSLIIGGIIDLGTRYTCWTEIQLPNLDRACVSKIVFSVLVSGLLYGLFKGFGYLSGLFDNDLYVSVCFLAGALNFGNLDWFIIRKYSPRYFLFIVCVYNIAPILLILISYFLEIRFLSIVAFPAGYAISGLFVFLFSTELQKPRFELFTFRSLLRNSLLVPGQQIFTQAFIPLLGFVLDLESLGQIKMLSVVISAGVSAATFLVLGSYKSEELNLSDFGKRSCSILFCLLILLPLLSLNYWVSIWNVFLFGFDLSLLLILGPLAIVLALLGYEQERLIFKKRQNASIVILYGYPAILGALVIAALTFSFEGELQFGVLLMTVSALTMAVPVAFRRMTQVSEIVFSPWFAKPLLLVTVLIAISNLIDSI